MDMEETMKLDEDEVIGEVEFFDLMKRANRDLNGHERWVVWTVTKRILTLGGNDDSDR
jgi:hypothetical protein